MRTSISNNKKKTSVKFNLFFKKNFYWNTVAVQYCVSFYRTAKWSSYMCTYTYIPSFLDFLPIWVTTEHWVEFPVLYSRFSLVIYFIHSINSVYMSTPVSQFIPPPLPPWYPYICSLCLCLYFCFVNKIVYTNFFRFDIYELIYDICFSLSDLLHSVWPSLGPSTYDHL